MIFMPLHFYNNDNQDPSHSKPRNTMPRENRRERGWPVGLICSSSSYDPSGVEDVLNPKNDSKGREKREKGSTSFAPAQPRK